MKLTKHFTVKELSCRGMDCCDGACHISPRLLLGLELLRDRLQDHAPGARIVITSGYRCPTHNKSVGGADMSQHTLGKAADLFSPDVGLASVYSAATLVKPFARGGIGLYNDRNFIHVDVREDPAPARWSK